MAANRGLVRAIHREGTERVGDQEKSYKRNVSKGIFLEIHNKEKKLQTYSS